MKKLYLNRRDGKIAGVCAGLSDYFELDVTVIRIAFLVALLFGTLGLWVYLIIWAVTPNRDGGTEVQY